MELDSTGGLTKAAARYGCRLLAFAALTIGVQAQAPDNAPRQLTGHVMRAVKRGLAPERGMMVTLHRVGADRAGPVDSTRTGADGRYAFTYRPSGNADAVYLASVGYQGIMYFSTPASASQPVPDGDITVFDTTSGPVPIRVAGHHIIVSAPRGDGLREVEEVFELSNDSSVTRIARGDSVPVWSALAPNDAMAIRGAPTSDIAPAAISVRGRRVELYAPISPGMRQLAYGYTVRAGSFPLTLALPAPNEVLEVLVEESAGHAEGAGLAELAPVSKGGRTFRRFLAQDVAANAAVRVDVPSAVSHESARTTRWITIALAASMAVALAWALARRRTSVAPAMDTPASTPRSVVEALLFEIASLDAAHEKITAPLPDERARYDQARAALKLKLVRALASRGGAH
jgi:5-hydroxyisourate hydrolase-like protein (transthyretin family)